MKKISVAIVLFTLCTNQAIRCQGINEPLSTEVVILSANEGEPKDRLDFLLGFPQFHEDSLFTGTEEVSGLRIADDYRSDFLMTLEERLVSWGYENITVKITYEKGVKTWATAYFENGQKYGESEFNAFGLNGRKIEWYKNGTMRLLLICDNGRPITPEIIWHDDGSLMLINETNMRSIGWYKDGSLYRKIVPHQEGGWIFIKYYPDGSIWEKMHVENGIQPYEKNFRNGNPEIRGKIDGVDLFRVGTWQEWYESGQKKAEIYYHEEHVNLRLGTWKYWDEEGNLTKEEFYEAGKLVDVKEYVPQPDQR